MADSIIALLCEKLNTDARNVEILCTTDGLALAQVKKDMFFVCDSVVYKLTSHPFEPCLYLSLDGRIVATVHNAFDTAWIEDAARNHLRLESPTGKKYIVPQFCRILRFAKDMGSTDFSFAERAYTIDVKERIAAKDRELCEQVQVVTDDPFYEFIAQYPDSVVDFRIVKSRGEYKPILHRGAIIAAMKTIEGDWECDTAEAEGIPLKTDLLFSSVTDLMTYRNAFLNPPHQNSYTDADFDAVNAALFPEGTDSLEAVLWTTDWSDYFDEGHEWWGALCLSVYDKKLDRFVVIMASATD